jgi:hypothetical protein
MRETGLMDRLLEPAVRCPAIAHEDAGELGAEHGRRFRKAPARSSSSRSIFFLKRSRF